MRDFAKERIAITNGQALNNKMLKQAERKDIEREYIIINEYADAYNSYSKTFSAECSKTISKLRKDYLRRIKYALYYNNWDY